MQAELQTELGWSEGAGGTRMYRLSQGTVAVGSC